MRVQRSDGSGQCKIYVAYTDTGLYLEGIGNEGMFFSELHQAVLDCLRSRVKNGQSTERGLARMVGVSQPHMHNVLKGSRSLSSELSDQILYHLRLSLLDLIDREKLLRYVESEPAEYPIEYRYLPVLAGKLGPGHPWPTSIDRHERFCVPASAISRMVHPVIVRVAEDVRMHPLFSDGDLALLDQSQKARISIDPGALYVIKRGRTGLMRRLKYLQRRLYTVSDDVADRPAGWEVLPLEDQPIQHFVRARAIFVTRELEWNELMH